MRRWAGAGALLILVQLLTPSAYANPGEILTVAGGGVGDGGQAISASVYYPYGVAVDFSGNLYIADYGNNRIRKVNADGVISTVAGNGSYGFSGDGGQATSATLNYPFDVDVDSSGNLYIADAYNHRIRKVNTAGVISTVAGNGSIGFSGDGGQATSAAMYNPLGVAVDSSGNVYIADSVNGRIRKVNTAGVISTVAGNGSNGFSGDGGQATSATLNNPTGVAVDSSGNLYIAGDQRIRIVNTLGVISTVAGSGGNGDFWGDGGQATSAALWQPHGVAVDSSGNLYIGDHGNHRIRTVNTAGVISTLAGNGGYRGFLGDEGQATSAGLYGPGGVAVDSSGNFFIADTGNGRIRKVNGAGVISTVAGGQATSASLDSPSGVVVDPSGNLYIADTYNHRIRKVNTAGVISTVAGTGDKGSSGNGGPATSAHLNYPRGVAVDPSGNLFIADTQNHRIRWVNTAGVISNLAGKGIGTFSGDGGPATSAGLNYPTGVALDPSGTLYIADPGNHRIRKVNTAGVISTVAGKGTGTFSGDGGQATSATLYSPTGVAVDPCGNGNLFIADTFNNRIRKVNAGGVISTIAGNASIAFSGDGGQATSASLDSPSGVAVDPSGNLFIADRSNQRIRMVMAQAVVEPPCIPQHLTAIAGPANGQITLNWSAPATDRGASISNYRIFRSTSSNAEAFLASVSGNVLTFTDSGLASYVRRYYKVSAVNLAGEGPLSNEANAFTYVSAPPSAPRYLSAALAVNPLRTTLSWSAPNIPNGPVTYLVYRGTSTNEELFLASTSTTIYDDSTCSVATMTICYYKVKAVNIATLTGIAQESPFSNEVSSPATRLL